MLESLAAAFRSPELKKRIQYLILMMAVYVLGLHITIPGVDPSKLFGDGGAFSGGLVDMMDMFGGGAFKKYAIFAMGIMPYINASIIMQLLTIAFPSLAALQKEGPAGQKKIKQWTRWLTGILAFFQSFMMTMVLKNSNAINDNGLGWLYILYIAVILTAGTCFLVWMGEMITEKGIGNGVSMVIFAGIMVTLPFQLFSSAALAASSGVGGWFRFALLMLVFIATVAFMVAVTQAQRKVPIQNARRTVGNKVYGGQATHLPLKVNAAGVIPIIFAVSIQYFPLTIANALAQGNQDNWFVRFASGFAPGGSWWGSLIYALGILLFTYFYTAVTFNVADVTENLKKQGSYIPGIRPGKPTQEYLDKIMTRITLFGAIFLAIVALIQYYIPGWLGFGGTFSLIGGTSLLIVVGVALDTMQQIESQLLMRHYQGFIK
ncbi:MAG: preprotein translocase subunit SecY [Abditibacteriota bacterium]|nr:preprotein translocase subunit SecY [Abditibacteriota bacterium]